MGCGGRLPQFAALDGVMDIERLDAKCAQRKIGNRLVDGKVGEREGGYMQGRALLQRMLVLLTRHSMPRLRIVRECNEETGIKQESRPHAPLHCGHGEALAKPLIEANKWLAEIGGAPPPRLARSLAQLYFSRKPPNHAGK